MQLLVKMVSENFNESNILKLIFGFLNEASESIDFRGEKTTFSNNIRKYEKSILQAALLCCKRNLNRKHCLNVERRAAEMNFIPKGANSTKMLI